MKVNGSYTNVIGGVSEQEPYSRRDGQMTEQINMISDPLVGLVRRHGSEMMRTSHIGTVTPARWEEMLQEAMGYVAYQTAIDSEWYDIIYRKSYDGDGSLWELPVFAQKHNADNSITHLPCVAADEQAQTDLVRGVSAITTVGRYVLMAPSSKPVVFGSYPIDLAYRNAGVAWVRGGTYSREYTLKFTAVSPEGTRTRHTVKYKTNPSTYPEPLDTSAVDWADPNYSKIISDITGAYNSAVTIYTGESAKKIQPNYIAAQLARLAAIAITGNHGSDIGSGDVPEGLPVKPGDVDANGFVLKADHTHSVTVHILDDGPVYGETHTFQKGQNIGRSTTCPKCKEFLARNQPRGVWHDKPLAGQQNWIYPGGLPGVNMAADVERPNGLTWPIPSKTTIDPWAEGYVDGAKVDVPWGEPIDTGAAPVQVGEGYIVTPPTSSAWMLEDFDFSDGGAGDLVRACQFEARNVDELTPKHVVGSVIEIRPDRGKESFGVYMVAESSTGAQPGEFSEVVWNEGTLNRAKPDQMFCIGTVHNGQFVYASSPDILATHTGLDVPRFMHREVGDETSAPVPDIHGRMITYMGMFQDRLMVAAGNVLLFSRPGDYFNFFRKSALRVDASDPVEVYPTGSEGDSIYASVPSGRNFLLFGDGYQYLLAGHQVLTPENAGAVMQLSSFDNVATVQPVASGNYTFYPSVGEFGTSLQEIPTAYLTDSPETSNASTQLKHYIKGTVRQLAAITNPNTVLMLTTGLRNGLYLMRYEDAPGASGHLVNAWFKWTWNSLLGQSLGATMRYGRILVPFLRSKPSAAGREVYVVTDALTLDARVSDKPHLDSMVPMQTRSAAAWHDANPELTQDVASVAYGDASAYWLMGSPLRQDWLQDVPTLEHLYLGLNFEALVVPTNPMIRGEDGKANRTGKLIIGQILVRTTGTGGCEIIRMDKYGNDPSTLKRRDSNNAYTTEHMSGERPVGDWNIQGYVGRQSDLFTYMIRALTWLPLNIVKIDWGGQYFRSGRRV